MHLPRMTTRRWMIVIAVLAPVFLVLSWFYKLGRALDDLYGPRGRIALGHRISVDLNAAAGLLQQGSHVEAEAQFRSILKLNEELKALNAAHGWSDFSYSNEILLGVADALAGQGRFLEAEPHYRKVLSIREGWEGRNELALADVLERYAAFLRKAGRVSEANELEDQAAEMEARAEAIRNARKQ